MHLTKTLRSLFILLLLGFIWGSGYSLAKFAMTNNVPALGYSFWQAFGPALILSICCLVSKQKNWLNSKHWLYFFICGLFGIAVPNTNMYLIANHLSAGLLAVLVNTVPLLVYPLALLCKQERPDFFRFLAILIGVTGILLIIGIPSISSYSQWTLLALISPLSFALCSIYIGIKKAQALNVLESAAGMLIAASIILVPIVIHQHAFYTLAPPYTVTKLVVILEILLSSFGYLLFFLLVRNAGPVFYSLTGGVVALTGLFWSYWIFDESPSVTQGLATTLIILAIALLSWRRSNYSGGD